MQTLSIIVPVFNESTYIIRCLKNVVQTELPGWKKEIIVVNDGSTDDTGTLLEKYQKTSDIRIISFPENKGKGAALMAGIKEATGDVLIVQDGDLEYDPVDYKKIVDKYEDETVSVVYGSRILGAKIYHNYNANTFFLLGGLTLSRVVNILFGTNLTDQPTCYKTWRSSLSQHLLDYCHNPGFAFEIEMTAFFSSVTEIVEVPIRYYPRSVSHGKKITFSDFIISLITALQCKFRPNPLPVK